MKRVVPLIFASALLLGCGNAVPTGDLTTRQDSAGIEIVTSTAADRGLDWEFQKVLSLGGAASGVEAFYQVQSAGLGFDATGRIYVLDSGNKRVVVFDSAGVPIRTIGRGGEGPGEFRYPTRLAVDPAGDVFVYDLSQRALIHFDTAGSYAGEMPIIGSVHRPIRVDGSRLVFATRARDRDTGELSATIHRTASDDSAALLTMPLSDMRQVYYGSCGLGMTQAPLFSNTLTWDARAHRVAIVDAPHYWIRVFEDGIETRHVRRSIEAEVATREHAVRELGDGQELHGWAHLGAAGRDRHGGGSD